MNKHILQYLDFYRFFNVTANAINVAEGAVLCQVPSTSELKYPVTEKYLLAIVCATKKWKLLPLR